MSARIITVDDIAAALAKLSARGIQLIDEEPRPGIHNTLAAFLHPKSTTGVPEPPSPNPHSPAESALHNLRQ